MKTNAKIILVTIALLTTALTSGCGIFEKWPVGNKSVPNPSQSVDLQKYLGRWYEYARYENRFEKNCEAVTADYSLRNDGTIKVVNTCRQDNVNGKTKTAEAHAKIVDGSKNAKLKVSFFRPFYGDYWVLDHDKDYKWSIVGEPSGRYLWLLFRSPHPSAKDLESVESRVKKLGYDVSLLRKTKQVDGK